MIVVNPHRGKKPVRDFKRLCFYEREKEGEEPAVGGDTEYTAVWLAAIKQRQQR